MSKKQVKPARKKIPHAILDEGIGRIEKDVDVKYQIEIGGKILPQKKKNGLPRVKTLPVQAVEIELKNLLPGQTIAVREFKNVDGRVEYGPVRRVMAVSTDELSTDAKR
jgi:hypothetical protein